MISRQFSLSLILFLFGFLGINGAIASEFRYVGGDVSLLPDYEDAGAKYYNRKGEPVADLLEFCLDQGMNCMRVRLFVNPDDYSGPDKDPNAKQSLEYILPLCKRIVDDGFALMLDFHYSDTWADPGAQWTPKAWEGLSDMELYDEIYDYTRQTLQTLRDNDIVPAFIQPGNEISYGMLWGPYGTSNPKKVTSSSNENWGRFTTLLRRAIKACREVFPDAGIVLHTERVEQVNVLSNFYSKVSGLDYDIIGLSYYPYFHGDISVLDKALTSLETEFPEKDIMIVETGYPYQWEVPGTKYKDIYPLSEAGQNQFAKDIVDTLLRHETCNGLLWWWFEYNARGTSLTGWYNAPLFNSNSGKVTPAMETICSFGSGRYEAGIDTVGPDVFFSEDQWFTIQGFPCGVPVAPGLYIHNGRKLIIK